MTATETPAGVAAVLALHTPVRRYQAASRTDTLTYPTPERAHQVNLRHSMRGFESLVITSPEDAPFVEVCKECSRVENAFEQHGYGYDDDHDDEQDGTELSMNASAWPCATYGAVVDSLPVPEGSALAAIQAVVDRWENGALVNHGSYEGTVYIEPLETLPPGLDEIREALNAAGGQ